MWFNFESGVLRSFSQAAEQGHAQGPGRSWEESYQLANKKLSLGNDFTLQLDSSSTSSCLQMFTCIFILVPSQWVTFNLF